MLNGMARLRLAEGALEADAAGPEVHAAITVHNYTAVAVIIPALNEEEAITQVLRDMPLPCCQVTVVDNGSTDATAARAQALGARVVHEPRRGYGRACLAGLAATRGADVVVFMDGDFSDDASEMWRLLEPIVTDDADFVLGARPRSARPWAARLGTGTCVWLINRLWGGDYRDLGPFRAIRSASLDRLGLGDQTWGWTIEMQVRAIEAGLRRREIPVACRPRIGQAKISGTVGGVLRAGLRMLWTIASLYATRHRRQRAAIGG